MAFQKAGRNALPVDPVTGGQAFMVDWFDFNGAVHTDTAGGVATVQPNEGISTSPITDYIASYPMPVVAGATYTAAVTVDGLALVCLQWISEDGVAGDRIYGYGWTGHRAVATGIAPASAYGAVVNVFVPVLIPVGDPVAGAQSITYYAPVQWPDAPGVVLADWNPDEPVLVSGAVFVQSQADPGPLPPFEEDTSIGRFWYDQLPDLYRRDDTSGVLAGLLTGWAAPTDTVRLLGQRIADGDLTSPARADATWVHWLAQAVGVPVQPTFEATRELLLARGKTPSVGTPGALASLAATWLTGTKQVDVSAGAEWTITVRVLESEVAAVGGTAALDARIRATGQVPAGFILNVVTGQQTWGELDAAATSWGAVPETMPWGQVDELGT